LEVGHPDHQFYLANGLLTSNSHSDAYSVVTMQTAYLATYHPLEFYTAALTKAQANAVQTLIADIQKTGTKILPVDINMSKGPNVIEDGSIRLALSSVLGVGAAAVEKIVAGQPYSGFLDFLDRSGVSKTAVGPLVMVGAFSSLPDCGNIRRLEWFYERYCADPKLKQKKRRDELEQLFFAATINSTNAAIDVPKEDYALHEKVFIENQLMGFSLVGTPFEILDRKKKIDAMFEGISTDYETFLQSEEEVAMLPVCLKEWKEKPQRNGQMFAFMKFMTESGQEFDAPAFGNIWKWIGPKARKGSVYVVTFNRDIDDDPENLKVGKPGWAHSKYSAEQSLINVDEISLA
jgi:DNA polymerase III alpha subunit